MGVIDPVNQAHSEIGLLPAQPPRFLSPRIGPVRNESEQNCLLLGILAELQSEMVQSR